MIKKLLVAGAVTTGLVLAGGGTAEAAQSCYFTYSAVFGYQVHCVDSSCQHARPGQPC